jgi:ABC-type ATPase involved in cell division
MLKVENVSKRFPGVQALSSVSLEVNSGRVHALVGENGAGKSTLVKIISGAQRPDSGRIIFNDVVFEEYSPAYASAHGISVVYQRQQLVPMLSVAENILLGEQPRHSRLLIDRAETYRIAGELLNRLHVDVSLRKRVVELTPALQQEIAIAKVVTYFSNNSQSQELANVEDAISKKVDGILMYAVSLSAESADVAKANAANIPIFLLYGYDKNLLPKVAGFEQVDLIHYGKEVGVWLTKHLTDGKVAIITGLLGRGDAEAYAQGFKDGLADNKQLTVVAQVPGDWNRQKAQHAAQDLITAHPDLKALYVENEDMAIGAILALKRAGKLAQVMVVSCNGAPYGLEAIGNAEIQASNTC